MYLHELPLCPLFVCWRCCHEREVDGCWCKLYSRLYPILVLAYNAGCCGKEIFWKKKKDSLCFNCKISRFSSACCFPWNLGLAKWKEHLLPSDIWNILGIALSYELSTFTPWENRITPENRRFPQRNSMFQWLIFKASMVGSGRGIVIISSWRSTLTTSTSFLCQWGRDTSKIDDSTLVKRRYTKFGHVFFEGVN